MPARLGSVDMGADGMTRRRDANVAWRKWYKTTEWRRLRWACLVRDLFTCRMCGWIGGNATRLLVADHRLPHRGDRALFFDIGNLQCLCKPCHDGAKQSHERSRGAGG